MSAHHAVTIIIPTLGLRSRVGLLRRAVTSVLEQDGVRAIPLVVVNGAQRTPDVESMLLEIDGVEVLSLAEAGIPRALIAGRDAVRTPWFGTLDDDDRLMPDALARRIRILDSHPDSDVVVTNGFRSVAGHEVLHIRPDNRIAANPLRAFRDGNWLLPGCWLARTGRVDSSLFHGMPSYRECTFLALRFCTEYRMTWSDEPTIVYSAGSPDAISHSVEYMEGQVEAVRDLLALQLPGYARRMIKWDLAGALHVAAERAWVNGELEKSWRLHRQSLGGWFGLRFLPFTRHLIRSEIQQRALLASRTTTVE